MHVLQTVATYPLPDVNTVYMGLVPNISSKQEFYFFMIFYLSRPSFLSISTYQNS